MILRLFTVYDEKAHCYTNPFVTSTAEVALRSFSDCINSPDHHFGKNPHDYTLFDLGEFDDNTGIYNTKSPQAMGNGVEFRTQIPLSSEKADENRNVASIQPSSTG